MIVESPLDFKPINVFVRLRTFERSDITVYLKNETFNPAGSIKFKPAVGIVKDLEEQGILSLGRGIIDTTSGNMGIALSIVARARGYAFVCVSDDKITEHNRALLEAYGTELIIRPKSSLNDRFNYIRQRIEAEPNLIWTRQFLTPLNPDIHERTTAQEVFDEIPEMTHLIVGTGTAGTLVGCAQALSKQRPKVQLVAVDAEGSYHFSHPASGRERVLPGIGASERSRFLDGVHIDRTVIIAESDAVAAVRDIACRTGWLFGASSGSVIAAIQSLQSSFCRNAVIVGIAADSGERYLDTVYNEAWVAAKFDSRRAVA